MPTVFIQKGYRFFFYAADLDEPIHVHVSDDYQLLAPVFLPDLDEVRRFAKQLHASGEAWEGEAFGWNAGYSPSSTKPPPDSKMTFTPADFWIGDGALWFFALLWERGNDQPPVETIYNENVVGTLG